MLVANRYVCAAFPILATLNRWIIVIPIQRSCSWALRTIQRKSEHNIRIVALVAMHSRFVGRGRRCQD